MIPRRRRRNIEAKEQKDLPFLLFSAFLAFQGELIASELRLLRRGPLVHLSLTRLRASDDRIVKCVSCEVGGRKYIQKIQLRV